MEIKTKYSIGDKVYTMYNNLVKSFTIGGIEVGVREDGDIFISYKPKEYIDTQCPICANLTPGKRLLSVSENRIFPSKEELLKSL